MREWAEIVAAEPQFAERVRGIFSGGVHKTIATLRPDGSPRISGIEVEFTDHSVELGMMHGSVKLRDVLRDPRVAIHSPTFDPPEGEPWTGDAKLAGVLVPLSPVGEDDDGAFRLDVREVVITRVENDELVVESWCADRGLQVRRRD